MKSTRLILIAAGALLLPLASSQAQPTPGAEAQPTAQQRAQMIRERMAQSQNQLHAYEWIETTVVKKDGEEKSRIVKRCFYGADGKLQKVVLSEKASKKPLPGILLFGRLVDKAAEHKKEEMEAYIKKAVELVHDYIPPLPGLIQQSIKGGKLTMQMLDPGRLVRLTFGDYLKPGDSLSVEIGLPANQLLGLAVSTYLDDKKDSIAMDVTMSALPDGTIYAARSVLTAKAKGLTVSVENTHYQHLGS
jgi:hypothetical protein